MEPAGIARIRFVTRRHRELQGLRLVAVSLCVLAAFWSRPYMEALREAGPGPAFAGLLLSLLPFFLAAGLHAYFDGYYLRRFGAVANGWSWDDVWRVGLMIGAFVLDLASLDDGLPIAMLLAGSVIGLHAAVRDWPWRWHQLLLPVAGALGTMAVASGAVRVDGVDAYCRGPLTLVQAAAAVAALFDHRLLARTLPPHPDVTAATEHADPI